MDDRRTSGGTQGDLFAPVKQTTWEDEANKLRPVLQSFLGKGWFEALKFEFLKEYMINLSTYIRKRREVLKIYPPPEQVFRAFHDTPLEDTNVFIAGQDPYHNGNATGLAFANDTADSTLINCSLRKIFEYLGMSYDLGYLDFPPITDYSMGRWSSQGVLLLNRVLTVEANKPRSHKGKGWEIFTNRVVQVLNEKDHVVFMLWGQDARELSKLIDHRKHLILNCEHPAAACYGNRDWDANDCFNKANEYLITHGKEKILW